VPQNRSFMFNSLGYTNWQAVGYVFLGCFITASCFLAASTVYYRKKFYNFKQPNPTRSKIKPKIIKSGRKQTKGNHLKEQKTRQSKKPVTHYSFPSSYSNQDQQFVFSNSIVQPGEGLFQQEYDEQGVLVEKQVDGL